METASPSHRLRHLAIAAGAVALFAGGMWTANQGGVLPSEQLARFFGSVYQMIRSLPFLLTVWLGAFGIGLPIRRWLSPRCRHPLVVQLAIGLAALLLADWLLAAVGLLNAWTAWGVCGVGTAVMTYHVADPELRRRWHPDNWRSPPWTLLLALPVVGLLLVACTCPPGTLWSTEAFGYDVTSYHLQVPREWINRGGMTSLEHNVYSHLPMLSEVGYMKLAIMHGSMYDAIYSTQFFHATAALLAALGVGSLVRQFSNAAAGAFAGAMMLATPWTIVTGSLAYNEMFVLAIAAAAVLVLFDDDARTWRGALLIGLLCGAATMAKLTAGPMIALPVGVAMVFGWARGNAGQQESRTAEQTSTQSRAREEADEGNAEQRKRRIAEQSSAPSRARQEAVADSAAKQGATRPLPYGRGSAYVARLKLVGVFALGWLVVVAPYLIRNAAWTGNPVFPFATSVFGTGHWDDELAERWREAHNGAGGGAGVEKLPRQWLLNTGYGAINGQPTTGGDASDIARFKTEYGIPILWLLAAVGAVVLARERNTRLLVVVMLVLLAAQLLFWLTLTHHQSRFLMPTLLPGCVLAGTLAGFIRAKTKQQYEWAFPLLTIGAVALLTVTSFSVFFSHTLPADFTDEGKPIPAEPWQLVDSLVAPDDVTANQPGRFVGRHPTNWLPAGSRVLMVADAGHMLYVRREFIYSTAFDRGLLGELLDRTRGNTIQQAAQLTLMLRELGVTHVWIHFGEIQRLRDTYGFDERVTDDLLRTLDRLWRPVRAPGMSDGVGLYEVQLRVKLRAVQPPGDGGDDAGGAGF